VYDGTSRSDRCRARTSATVVASPDGVATLGTTSRKSARPPASAVRAASVSTAGAARASSKSTGAVNPA